LEGQRVFELAGDLASIIEIAHTPYLWPNGRAFSIKDIKIPLIGQRLSNTLPEVIISTYWLLTDFLAI
jgi:hypothetical protein